jgi:hypothetical protein
VLKNLHWLPIKERIVFKVLLHTYRALNNLAPQYLTDLLEVYKPPRTLRSQDKYMLKVPSTKLHSYGDRRFDFAAATLWNSLPDKVKNSESLLAFRKSLKTYLFGPECQIAWCCK